MRQSAVSFDEQPDGDPHGECAAEIHRLEARVAALTRLVLQADPWVQSRMHRRARKADITKNPFHKANHQREEQRSMDWLAGAAHFHTDEDPDNTGWAP